MKRSSSLQNKPFYKKSKQNGCPPYKIIEGTKFAVDGFCYGYLPGIEAYFLTHFHSDHYQGLTKNFSRPIYCSRVTGELCKQMLHVSSNHINILEEDKTVSVLGVNITAINAFHCPGSLLLIFNLPNGQNIVHCGDFRASFLMEDQNLFGKKLMLNTNINTIYLDTTFCDPKYDFPSQATSIEKAISILVSKKKLMIEKHQTKFSNLLIVCGTYNIGKEKFFLEVAKKFNLKIWAAPEKCKIMKTAIMQDFGKIAPHLCNLHLLPMNQLNFDDLDVYLKKHSNFAEIIAFKPSGWEHVKKTCIQRGKITIHGIPYSEHSSFSELQHFIKLCKPVSIISTIPSHYNSSKIQKYFQGKDSHMSQRKISDYFTSTITKSENC